MTMNHTCYLDMHRKVGVLKRPPAKRLQRFFWKKYNFMHFERQNATKAFQMHKKSEKKLCVPTLHKIFKVKKTARIRNRYNQLSMIRKYHNHKPQTNPWHHEEERHNNHETLGKQTKQSNKLSVTHQDDCKTRMDIK